MAILDNNGLTGLLGELVIRRFKAGKKIVQTSPRQYKQTKNTKEASKLFGYGSSLASEIRHQLASVTNKFHDPGMVNRFSSPVRAVLTHCYDKQAKVYTFEEGSFSRLAGFEFNVKSPLINFLWVKPVLVLDARTLKITIPEFKIPSQFTFPGRTNTCKVTISVSQINLNQGLTKQPFYYTFEIDSYTEDYPTRDILFEVDNECLCVAGIGLTYYTRTDGVTASYNSKSFNPANIIAAIITPGVYIEPIELPVSNRTYAKEWTDDHRLKL